LLSSNGLKELMKVLAIPGLFNALY
jgi:hypothetical protein